MFIEFENACQVLVPVAVVWCTPYGCELAAKELEIAILAKLVSAIHTIHIVLLQKAKANIFTKNVTCSASGNTEPRLVPIWVTPHEVSEWAFMRNFLNPLNLFDIIDVVHSWRESTMDAEDFVINYRRNW